ncbi:dihydrodipicolinate synthase family protein [Allostella vacuolata]|nr:dihydrodipicolinate synthase family protein [Stella vacuolata]
MLEVELARIPFDRPAGVIAACILPFGEDMEIDAAEYRRHVRAVSSVPGLSGMAQTELDLATLAENERVLDLMLEEVGDRLPVAYGVHPWEHRDLQRFVRSVEAKGASALTVRPPRQMAQGGQRKPEVALDHFRRIADATSLPIIVYQYPLGGGMGYPLDTLVRMAEEIPSIVAVKDWCNDAALHQKHIRVLGGLPRPVNVITAHSSWLMASLAMGCAGLCSSVGAVISDLQVALWQAVQAKDLTAAQRINDRIVPITQALYDLNPVDLHTGTKEALVILGRLQRAVQRPPLGRLTGAETARIRKAAVESGLLAPAEGLRAG